MANFSSRLRELRKAKGLTQQQLAMYVGISKSSINMYERGEREPGLEMLETIADFFNVDLDYLLGKSDVPNKYEEILNRQKGISGFNSIQDINLSLCDNIFEVKTHKIPLLGEIACGQPIYADEDRESYVEVGTDIKADFCLKAKGDSMINARILDGDIVFIREQPMVDNGEIAAVIIGDEATLKRVYYYRQEEKLILQAENPAYAPIVYVGSELEEVRILGKAIAFQSDVK